jgi:RNA polymerase sigma factor for flagellar operon FliA
MSSSPEATQKLMEEGQGLVISLATKIHRSIPIRMDLDDLIAYGELGLAEAARDFDDSHGTRFTTFAYYRVRGAIYDGLSKMSWTSRARYNRLRFERMANETLAQESAASGNASLESEAKWLRDVTDKLGIVFFASRSDDGQGGGIRDSTIEDVDAPSGPSIVAQREIVEKLQQLVNSLPRTEQRLVRAVYFEGATLQDAANSLGISKSWASRLHAKALEQLGRALRKLGASE